MFRVALPLGSSALKLGIIAISGSLQMVDLIPCDFISRLSITLKQWNTPITQHLYPQIGPPNDRAIVHQGLLQALAKFQGMMSVRPAVLQTQTAHGA